MQKKFNATIGTGNKTLIIIYSGLLLQVAGMSIHQLDRRNADQSIPYHDRPGTFKYGKYEWPEATKEDFQKETEFYLNHLILKLDFFNRYQ